MSKGDEIDELVSSVRNFVAHKDSNRMATPTPADRLVLSAESRLSDEQVKAIDAEWEAELRALEAAGVVAPGSALELSIAELEEAVAKLPDDWEPERPVLTLTEKVDQDPVTTDVDIAPARVNTSDAVDQVAIEAIVVSKMGEIFDEDALRDLVVKIVHEELSGDLGERITRNVRKLVRREINRVMTSRDLSGD